MPLYEYICQTCGRRFEKRGGYDKPLPDACPAGHRHVRRLISLPAVHFRGQGFYVTDQ